ASSSVSRISVSATIATAASRLPAISGKAWWLMNLTSEARGLTGGVASPPRAGARPPSTPPHGAPPPGRGTSTPPDTGRMPAAEGRSGQTAATLGLAGDLLADLLCARHRQAKSMGSLLPPSTGDGRKGLRWSGGERWARRPVRGPGGAATAAGGVRRADAGPA